MKSRNISNREIAHGAVLIAIITAIMFLLKVLQLWQIVDPFLIPVIIYIYAKQYNRKTIWYLLVPSMLLGWIFYNFEALFLITYFVIAFILLKTEDVIASKAKRIVAIFVTYLILFNATVYIYMTIVGQKPIEQYFKAFGINRIELVILLVVVEAGVMTFLSIVWTKILYNRFFKNGKSILKG